MKIFNKENSKQEDHNVWELNYKFDEIYSVAYRVFRDSKSYEVRHICTKEQMNYLTKRYTILHIDYLWHLLLNKKWKEKDVWFSLIEF